MPIYAYKCSACGFAKDVLQKLSDAPLTECLQCGASAFSKQVTAAGFQLKGSGWYVTDFRDGGGKKAAEKANGDRETSAPAEGAPASTGAADAPAPAASPTAAPAPSPAAAPAASKGD
ncbi:putative regulatory protein, FmdB family [Variovorax sp. PBL-H6]|uniref:FmdB family zinc ribbon protein n=1 Tax=Variovorax sp. PBL-H6 TaxID=434009 RepID=UPI0013167AF7|nr:FmdB family zinc ribbon protein [Variovorax sp. PBL-H6]VTU20398.1 putative regulatory protein, FmdB family [Variovorax sp. PBL-H6]